MIGALSEEMAEEQRELRRARNNIEPDQDDDDKEDIDSFQRRRQPFSSPRTRKRPTGSGGELFMRWVNDFNHGRKGLHDSMYGPPRSPKDGRPLSAAVDFFGVLVRNAHLVSDRFMHLIYNCMARFREHGLQSITFTDDGTPVVGGIEVLGGFDPEKRSIEINLRFHFEKVVRTIEHGHSGSSLIALIWKGITQTFLHEFAHAIDTQKHPDNSRRPREKREIFASGWAAEVATSLAVQGHLEAPKPSEEPYFGPLIGKHLDEALASGRWAWPRKQKSMMDDGIIFTDETSGIVIHSQKQYYELSLAGLKGDPAGKRLNEFITRGQALEEAAWDRDETHERLLRDAMRSARRIRIVHRISETQRTPLVAVPEAVFQRGPFIWVKLRSEVGAEPVEIRIDLIETIS